MSPLPMLLPMSIVVAFPSPYPIMYRNIAMFIITIYAAWLTTPNMPLENIINSKTHQSAQVIKVAGIAIFTYSQRP